MRFLNIDFGKAGCISVSRSSTFDQIPHIIKYFFNGRIYYPTPFHNISLRRMWKEIKSLPETEEVLIVATNQNDYNAGRRYMNLLNSVKCSGILICQLGDDYDCRTRSDVFVNITGLEGDNLLGNIVKNDGGKINYHFRERVEINLLEHKLEKLGIK